MSRTINIPCNIGDKIYAKAGDQIRELEICDIAVYIYPDLERIRIAAFINLPDPLYSDGRMTRKVFTFRLEEDAFCGERGFFTREEAEEYYESHSV